MQKVILFDVNETLLDLDVLQPHFERVFGEATVVQQWFSGLLHSSLVATLTDTYAGFDKFAAATLDTLAARRGVSLPNEERRDILATLQHLPPHPEVPDSLAHLRDAGLRLAVLTNSSAQMLSAQMRHAGLQDFFEILLSVDGVRKFKPAVQAYQMAAERLGVEPRQIRFVAAHDWDVHGALCAGCSGAFVARRGPAYHPMYRTPELTGADLQEVADRIMEKDMR